MTIPNIRAIADEVTRGYNPEKLPSLEEISWAFEIDGQDRVYYTREGYMNRIPNVQEGNAMYQLMLFRNLDNVLRFLSEGREDFQGITPDHTKPVGDAEDMAYMQTDYWRMLPEDIKKRKFNGLNLTKPNSYFWDNVPERLVRAVLRTDAFGRGEKDADEWGMAEHNPNKPQIKVYDDEALTRKYLQEMRAASEIGRQYFQQVAKSSEQAKRYPQLATVQDVSKWTKGQEFQWGYYTENGPNLVLGKVLSNIGDKLELELKPTDVGRRRNSVPWNDNYEINIMNEYCAKNQIWVPVQPEIIKASPKKE